MCGGRSLGVVDIDVEGARLEVVVVGDTQLVLEKIAAVGVDSICCEAAGRVGRRTAEVRIDAELWEEFSDTRRERVCLITSISSRWC